MNAFKKFMPYDCCTDIYKIDYNKLYSEGRKIILFDLDNTIIPYNQDYPDKEMIDLFSQIKNIGFEIVIMSNNHNNRITRVSEMLNVFGLANARKPFKYGYKKIIEKYHITSSNDVIAVGDQIITDVYGGSKVNFDVILVNAIARETEKWYTKINRITESIIIKNFKKRNFEIYKKIKDCRGEKIE